MLKYKEESNSEYDLAYLHGQKCFSLFRKQVIPGLTVRKILYISPEFHYTPPWAPSLPVVFLLFSLQVSQEMINGFQFPVNGLTQFSVDHLHQLSAAQGPTYYFHLHRRHKYPTHLTLANWHHFGAQPIWFPDDLIHL